MNPSAIIFDFDGTLHDSLYVYRTAFVSGYELLVEQGKAPKRHITEAQMASNIGLTAKEAWGRLFPDIPWSVAKIGAERVAQLMDEAFENGTARLFPGVPDVLTTLKDQGHELIFLSNCRNAYLDAVRAAFGFDEWFERYYTAEQFNSAPKPVIFETIREEVEGPFIAVGDRYKDLELARAHNLPSVGCLYGYGTRDELEGATCLAATPQEIVGCVERIEQMRVRIPSYAKAPGDEKSSQVGA